MGKNTKRVQSFIESIPDSKLVGLPSNGGTIYTDTDFRVDMQGISTGPPKQHNLQVQINKQTALKKSAPKTVASCLVLVDNPASAAQIKRTLIEKILV